MDAGREVFWNIQHGEILYILASIVVVIFIYAIYRRYKMWRLGRPEDRFSHIGQRIWRFHYTPQRRMRILGILMWLLSSWKIFCGLAQSHNILGALKPGKRSLFIANISQQIKGSRKEKKHGSGGHARRVFVWKNKN